MSVVTTVVTKFFLQSKGIWGIVGMAIPMALQYFGYHITDDQAGELVKAASGIWEAAMTGLATWGRVSATQPLSFSTKPVAIQVEQPAPQGGNIKGLKKPGDA